MWLALEKAKEEGKVRDIGVSNYGIGHIEEIKEIGKVWPPVVNQIEVGSFYVVYERITECTSSCTPGANNAILWTIARRTTSSSKHTVRSFAT
jgi:hypothetical protein